MEKKTSMMMTQYVTDFTSKAEQIAETDIEILDELLSIMFLDSLPNSKILLLLWNHAMRLHR